MSSFNQSLFEIVYGWSHRNIFLDYVGIFFAQYVPYFLVAGAIVILYYKKEWRARFRFFAEAAIAIMLGRGFVVEAIRFFYHHARPDGVLGIVPLIAQAGWSFPSAHAAAYFALATTVWYTNRRWGEWYFVLAVFMGVARVYVGVHWPLDILAGAVIGVLAAMGSHKLLKPFSA